MKNYTDSSIAANYFRGWESVGGKLYFDNNGITFKSHAFNFQTGEIYIRYTDISKVLKRNTLGIVPNGLSVFTEDNFEHKFVVYNRSDVIEFLQSKI